MGILRRKLRLNSIGEWKRWEDNWLVASASTEADGAKGLAASPMRGKNWLNPGPRSGISSRTEQSAREPMTITATQQAKFASSARYFAIARMRRQPTSPRSRSKDSVLLSSPTGLKPTSPRYGNCPPPDLKLTLGPRDRERHPDHALSHLSIHEPGSYAILGAGEASLTIGRCIQVGRGESPGAGRWPRSAARSFVARSHCAADRDDGIACPARALSGKGPLAQLASAPHA
eukprot:scaffold55_cov237-Pinguiococcus_pyrenoidosus.AAC.1